MDTDRGELVSVGTSACDRVKAAARARKEDSQFALQRFALERLMVRIQASPYAGDYALKGGMLMLCLPGGSKRPTEDMDLSSANDVTRDGLMNVLRHVCASNPPEEDGLTFQLDEPKCHVLQVESPHPTVRLLIEAKLHNRYGGVPMRLTLDVSQGEAISPGLSKIRLTGTCKGFEPPEVPCYPWETVVAEKLHAIVSNGALNTRLKDYWDIASLAKHPNLSTQHLANAVVATFAVTGRAIELEPYGLTDDFARERADDWKRFMTRKKLVGTETFSETMRTVREFALPILALASSLADDVGGPAAPAPF